MDDTGPITLQPLGPFDLDLAAALHGACFDVPWNAQTFAELLSMPGARGICALWDAEPAGFLLLLLQPPDGEILTLGVVPPRRQQGVGRALLAAAAGHARQAGAERLLLEVAADNNAAISLYRRAGFQRLSGRRQYYRRAAGPAVDADVFVLQLGTGASPVPAPAAAPGN